MAVKLLVLHYCELEMCGYMFHVNKFYLTEFHVCTKLHENVIQNILPNVITCLLEVHKWLTYCSTASPGCSCTNILWRVLTYHLFFYIQQSEPRIFSPLLLIYIYCHQSFVYSQTAALPIKPAISQYGFENVKKVMCSSFMFSLFWIGWRWCIEV